MFYNNNIDVKKRSDYHHQFYTIIIIIIIIKHNSEASVAVIFTIQLLAQKNIYTYIKFFALSFSALIFLKIEKLSMRWKFCGIAISYGFSLYCKPLNWWAFFLHKRLRNVFLENFVYCEHDLWDDILDRNSTGWVVSLFKSKYYFYPELSLEKYMSRTFYESNGFRNIL